MKKMLILGIAGLLLSSAAFAYPTLAGPTGNGVLPTAAVAPAGEWNVAADFYNTDDTSFPLRAVYGIAENFEVGAGYTLLEDANTWNVNAKWALPINLAGFDHALGVKYASNENDTTITNVYFTNTRGFAIGEDFTINGTIGVDWTQVDPDVFDSVDAIRFFIGADTTFANNLTLSAEFKSDDDDLDTDSLFAFTARYPVTDAITVQAGFTNADPVAFVSGTDDSNFFVGLNFTFGAIAEE